MSTKVVSHISAYEYKNIDVLSRHRKGKDWLRRQNIGSRDRGSTPVSLTQDSVSLTADPITTSQFLKASTRMKLQAVSHRVSKIVACDLATGTMDSEIKVVLSASFVSWGRFSKY